LYAKLLSKKTTTSTVRLASEPGKKRCLLFLCIKRVKKTTKTTKNNKKQQKTTKLTTPASSYPDGVQGVPKRVHQGPRRQ
jgi:hypothetical protein